METETQRAQKERTATGAQDELCPSCGAALVDGMRFCRMCGYRLGEGLAEYVETVRLDRMSDLSGMSPTPQGGQSLTNATGGQTTLITPPLTAPPAQAWKPKRSKKWTWLLLVLAFFVVATVGGRFAFRATREMVQARISEAQAREQPRSFVGASEFSDTEGMQGALLEEALPKSPAERAGLLDGDIITKFDGRDINGEDALRETISQTPIGKTVEVVYLRDGETQTTKLTTVSNKDYDLDAVVPRERGLLGIEDFDRVPVEGTKVHGVRIGEVYANRPADLAGLKEGDIITEFDGKPVRTGEGLGGYINLTKPASTVKLIVYRDGQRIELPVKMGRRN